MGDRPLRYSPGPNGPSRTTLWRRRKQAQREQMAADLEETNLGNEQGPASVLVDGPSYAGRHHRPVLPSMEDNHRAVSGANIPSRVVDGTEHFRPAPLALIQSKVLARKTAFRPSIQLVFMVDPVGSGPLEECPVEEIVSEIGRAHV